MPNSLYPVAGFVGVMWAVYLIDIVVPGAFIEYGLVPRTLRRLPGIVTMPFLHGGIGHLISNTIPIAILLSLTVLTRQRPWESVIAIGVCGGVLLWVFGRSANHIGASGLVFGLITFLIIVGFREKQLVSLMVAIAVGLFFGGSLLSGVIPSFGSSVSWDGHLFGAIAGVIVGIATTEKVTGFV
ncbi:rhomboid family intramembrane serine protease [Aporhodopirellula aestuarii]|uniref:Rhomboid family intramembrane serine protease n=1 Tax=Aporhodopirellula aestuarii TaxID=2950107 RepID=A0ABT0U638_9BACT|nr:rhomboid family intramembrane serine protease [Aporhodopirellula aestuarii]MCM2371801.1 rhomboid family intramembrane serine protease [Aporhodopirellula aestuarii]